MGLITVARRGVGGRRYEAPALPPGVADVVELYAREGGRTATMHHAPHGVWFARFSLRSNDKRMILFRQGLAAEPPTEDVWFHRFNPGAAKRGEPDYLPLDLWQIGATGVKDFLEKGNTWSGRGEYRSLEHAIEVSDRANERHRQKVKADAEDDVRHMAKESRGFRLKLPRSFFGRGKKQVQAQGE